jgi:Flp pilus assembly pilin Flp
MNKLKVFTTNKKGQASVEYLVLLAISIIIAVVAVGVLSGFIRIGTATTYKKKGGVYWKSAEIGIMDWEIYSTSASINSEFQVNLKWLSINGGTTNYSINKALLPGDTYRWQGTAPFNCSSQGTYSYTVTIGYDNMEDALTDKRFTGVEKMAGACSN